MSTIERWSATWRELGLTAPPRVFEELCDRYREPQRAYHTLQHLDECFVQLDTARALAERPAEVELALWFHDAIYDTRAEDSEDQSAAWARDALLRAGAKPTWAERVAALVLATKHAAPVAEGDAALLVDVDLAILGAPAPRFDEYEAQIRHEYAWVPEEAFRKARAAILAGFLDRPWIYATDHFSGRLEPQARANLRRSLERLRT